MFVFQALAPGGVVDAPLNGGGVLSAAAAAPRSSTPLNGSGGRYS
jgi:hypothetical protein